MKRRAVPAPSELLVGALELGGSHVASGRVRHLGAAADVEGLTRLPLRPEGQREELISTIEQAARAAATTEVTRWGIAVPGPFDYRRGISLIRGVGKLDALYGTDLRRTLAEAIAVPLSAMVFLNDADAFLLGEVWQGAARGCSRAIGITLGTGLGSAFLVDGQIVESGQGVPPEGRLDLLTLDGRPVEDFVSARGLLRTYALLGGADPSVAESSRLAVLAADGDALGLATFERFGESLGRVLAPSVELFRPDKVVVGGSIARAAQLFFPAIGRSCPLLSDRRRLVLARNPEVAPLLGAASHALRALLPGPR